MPYEVQPEQCLLSLSESDFYQQLLELAETGDKTNQVITAASETSLVVYDITDSCQNLMKCFGQNR